MKKIVNLIEILFALILKNDLRSFIDLGCSYGSIAKAIKTNLPHMKVTGIDIASPYIKEAKKDSKGVKFSVKDIRKTGFKKNQFDMAFTLGTFIHVPKEDIKSAMEEVLRISRNCFFIESSVVLDEKATKKYDCKKYWEKRAAVKIKDENDTGTVYYFAHNYKKLFKELGVKYSETVTDPSTNTKVYTIWENQQ